MEHRRSEPHEGRAGDPPVRAAGAATSRRSWSTGGRSPMSSTPVADPDALEELWEQTETESDTPWVVLVWNDPVNLMDYVVFVFQKLFGYSRAKATRLMQQVHYEGKAVVA